MKTDLNRPRSLSSIRFVSLFAIGNDQTFCLILLDIYIHILMNSFCNSLSEHSELSMVFHHPKVCYCMSLKYSFSSTESIVYFCGIDVSQIKFLQFYNSLVSWSKHLLSIVVLYTFCLTVKLPSITRAIKFMITCSSLCTIHLHLFLIFFIQHMIKLCCESHWLKLWWKEVHKIIEKNKFYWVHFFKIKFNWAIY